MMDHTMTPVVEEVLNDIEVKCAEVIHKELEKGTLTYEESQAIAQQILVESEKVSDQESMSVFLRTLSSIWPMFEKIAADEEVKTQQNALDSAKVEVIKNQLSQLS